MADTKISQLPVGTALTLGTETIPLVQNGQTVSITTNQLINRTSQIGGATATFTRINLLEHAGGAGTIQLIFMQSHDDAGVTDATLRVIGTAGSTLGIWTTSGGMQVSTGFGCNSKTPQTAVTVNAASVDLASVIALCNQLRAALIANGICQ